MSMYSSTESYRNKFASRFIWMILSFNNYHHFTISFVIDGKYALQSKFNSHKLNWKISNGLFSSTSPLVLSTEGMSPLLLLFLFTSFSYLFIEHLPPCYRTPVLFHSISPTLLQKSQVFWLGTPHSENKWRYVTVIITSPLMERR